MINKILNGKTTGAIILVGFRDFGVKGLEVVGGRWVRTNDKAHGIDLNQRYNVFISIVFSTSIFT
jgi:hypothetical protein